ncbi:MAG: tRNA 2-selenouridine(34) synthase MnmH [Roseinatronobacter sp.]
MRLTLAALSDLLTLTADTIIDVRAPAEFAQDHLPGAINLPVLDDAERAQVGTIYKQISHFQARKLGAALVAQNAARHLQGPLADKSGGWQPLVYCWRGGQRSGSFALILSQIGWRVQVLDGGYKAYRRLVTAALYDSAFPSRVVLLDGGTGSAKTDILQRVAALGGQVLDLEALAGHRGSVFGGSGAQPSQKLFESRLGHAMARLDPARPVLIEAEANRIGKLRLPPALWAAMVGAMRVRLVAPVAARAAWSVATYGAFLSDAALLSATLDKLRKLHPRKRIEDWQALAASGAFLPLAESLIADHYDPAYAHAAKGFDAEEITLPDLSDESRDCAARAILGSLY